MSSSNGVWPSRLLSSSTVASDGREVMRTCTLTGRAGGGSVAGGGDGGGNGSGAGATVAGCELAPATASDESRVRKYTIGAAITTAAIATPVQRNRRRRLDRASTRLAPIIRLAGL